MRSGFFNDISHTEGRAVVCWASAIRPYLQRSSIATYLVNAAILSTCHTQHKAVAVGQQVPCVVTRAHHSIIAIFRQCFIQTCCAVIDLHMIGVAAKRPLIGRCCQRGFIYLRRIIWFCILLAHIVATADMHIVPLGIFRCLCELERAFPRGIICNRHILCYCCRMGTSLRQGNEFVAQ